MAWTAKSNSTRRRSLVPRIAWHHLLQVVDSAR